MVNPFVNDAISYIKEIFYSCNLVELLNYTVIYSVDELIPYIEDQIKQDSIYAELCINKFDQLLPLALNHFFKFKLYLNVPESTIFKTLIGCIRRNSHYSYPILELLQHIELHLLTENELDLLFEPTKLIDHSSCLNLLHQQREQAEKITKIENKNVIKGFHDLRVIRGRKCQYDDKIFVINGNECYIDIDLKQQFLLNCIKLKLGKLPEDQMSYTVLVSKDMHTWSPIIDHSKHKCFGPQLLYFNERPIRFIRIEACPFDYFNELCLHGNIEVLYSTDPMEIDPTTTFLIPQQTLLAKNLKLMSDNFHKTFPANDKYQGNDLIFQLPQPCIIDSMKLWFGGPTSYHIDIAATEKWIRVFSENEVIGWRYATFKKQPVSYIKITSKAHNHVISFEGFKFPAI
uniref:F5/8 type C domain-containing protein n=1 Tax=Panagrellus redivivus TaxID=6233 RepID=A0A7E4VPQ9_PANRE